MKYHCNTIIFNLLSRALVQLVAVNIRFGGQVLCCTHSRTMSIVNSAAQGREVENKIYRMANEADL